MGEGGMEYGDYEDYGHQYDESGHQLVDGGGGEAGKGLFLYEYIVPVDGHVGPFKCTVCGKLSSHKSNLRKHVENIHFPGYIAHSCKHCTEIFPTRNHLNHHISLNHS